MEIIINDDNLRDEDVSEVTNKSRAILVTDSKMLVCSYAGVVLFPGGSLNPGESYDEAVVRELAEETGAIYDTSELQEYLIIKYYQKDYPLRDGKVANRLVITKYYIGNFKGLNIDNTSRTLAEKQGNFGLIMVDFGQLLDLIKQPTTNPRKPFFTREILTALDDTSIKKMESGLRNGARA